MNQEKSEQESNTDERYAALLAAARPSVIGTAEEHERLLSEAEALMEKGNALAPEEVKLLSLLVFLIEAYEASLDDAEADDDGEDEPAVSVSRPELPQPYETLRRLMQARKLELSDVEHVFGNSHLAREVIAGKRTISRGQAKELARFFQVPAKLFY